MFNLYFEYLLFEEKHIFNYLLPYNLQTRSKIGTEFSNPGLPSETNSSESNSKSSTMGSTASATDSFSHVNAISNVISENNDQENNKKGQPTWTQFDEVDIESREYNNKLYYTVEM